MQKKDYLFLLTLGLVSLVLFFHSGPVSVKVDDFTDRFFYYLNKKNFQAEEIVVVEIDDSSLGDTEDRWPFRRALYAKALENLQEERPKVIGFDVVFVGGGFSEDDDKRFLEAIRYFKEKIVLAYILGERGNPIYPKKEFRENSLPGFINVYTDKDKIVRKARAHFTRGDFSDFSWTVKICSIVYNVLPKKIDGFILLGDKRIPVNEAGAIQARAVENGTINISYLLKPEDITTISFKDLVSRNFSAGFFSDKIVLIAATAAVAHDTHATPLGYMPGVFIHANVVADILKGKLLKFISWPFSFLILVLTLGFLGYLLVSFTFLRRIFLSLGVLLVLFWLNIALKFSGWQLDYGKIFIPSLIFLVAGNFYTYTNFLVGILKIKNRIIVNPLTNLYNIRYFFEKLNFESRSIAKGKKYLVVAKLEGFKFLSKSESFESLRDIWRDISSFLFTISNLWTDYSQEVVVGKVGGLKDAQRLKMGLEEITTEREIKVTIRVGCLRITPSLERRNIVPFMTKKLEGTSEEIVMFAEDDFSVSIKSRPKHSDFLSSLYVDVEEKNRELMEVTEKFKIEQVKSQEAYLQLIFSLIVALESKDPYTEGHTKRVCEYALMLADKLNLSEEEKDKIKKGALLHDLGKIGIPDSILHKRGSLTDEEFSRMKEHELLSEKILEPIKEFKDIIPYVVSHHENFDGGGYPYGIAGNFIPLGARIIAVADTFDALITGRDYKKAFSIKKAVEELEKMRGKKLDPSLLDKFIEVLKESRIL